MSTFYKTARRVSIPLFSCTDTRGRLTKSIKFVREQHMLDVLKVRSSPAVLFYSRLAVSSPDFLSFNT